MCLSNCRPPLRELNLKGETYVYRIAIIDLENKRIERFSYWTKLDEDIAALAEMAR